MCDASIKVGPVAGLGIRIEVYICYNNSCYKSVLRFFVVVNNSDLDETNFKYGLQDTTGKLFIHIFIY